MAESAPAFAQHEDLEVTASGKCRCKITGHEMAMQQGVVEVGRDPAHFPLASARCPAGTLKPRTSGEAGRWPRGHAAGPWHKLCGCKPTNLVTVSCRLSDSKMRRLHGCEMVAGGGRLT